MADRSPVWELRGIKKTWSTGRPWRPSPRLAVDGVDLVVHEGERVGLIGESGSGKTTLVRAGLGLVARDEGTVRLFGEDTRDWSAARWLAARRHAQLLFQDPRAMLNPAMTLGTLLRESARLHRPEVDPRDAAARALDAVGLGGRDRALPHQLSGGERRRAGIARLLLTQPRLVVCDEMTAGLDAALKASLVELLLEQVGPKCAVVLIAHDIPMIAWACERVAVLQAGRVVDAFPTSDLAEPATRRHPYTRQLLAAAGMPLDPQVTP